MSEKIQVKGGEIDPEEFGLLLAKTCGWNGDLIFKTVLSALEGVNFHTVRAELIRTWEKVEGPLYD